MAAKRRRATKNNGKKRPPLTATQRAINKLTPLEREEFERWIRTGGPSATRSERRYERFPLPEVKSPGAMARPGIPIADMRRMREREDTVRQWFSTRSGGRAFPERVFRINLNRFIQTKGEIPTIEEMRRIVSESLR